MTRDPNTMGGRPCSLVGMVAAGRSVDENLRLHPYLVAEDIREALAYAAWRVEEIELPLVAG